MIAPIFAANWKMNNGPTTAREFMLSFCSQYPRQNDRTIIFFPPALSFHSVAAVLGDRRDILLGVQNIYWEDQGAFTGELSVPIARDAGARLALVGHSERRHVFGETDEDCAKKCAAVERGGLTPLLCVGETLAQREAGEASAEAVVTQQLRIGLSKMTQLQHRPFAIAYEPVWAIGTGRNATPDDAAAMHEVIRNELDGALRRSVAHDQHSLRRAASIRGMRPPCSRLRAWTDYWLAARVSIQAHGWRSCAELG